MNISLLIDPKQNREAAALAEAGRKALRANKRFRREILSNSQEVLVKNEYGALVQTRTFLWPVSHHDEVIRRTTQGLYFHHTRKSLFDLNCDVEVYYHGRTAGEIPELARSMNLRTVGTRQFNYAFGIAEEDPTRSVWFYEFYETHYASASTSRRGDVEMQIVADQPDMTDPK